MLEIILITILALWLFGKLSGWLLRRWVARRQREFAERMAGGGGFAAGGNRRRRPVEGEISVEQTVRMEKKVSRSVGDYVEYEEVDVASETERNEVAETEQNEVARSEQGEAPEPETTTGP